MIVIPIEPMGKPRMTQRDKWAKRKVVLRYFAYCDALRFALPNYVVPERLGLRFTIAMPKSWSNKKRVQLAGKPHTQRPDSDNLAKAFMDALCEDDSFIHTLYVEKVWGLTGSVQVVQLPEMAFDGIFDTCNLKETTY